MSASSIDVCCDVIPRLWDTYASDGNLCLCSPDFRNNPEVEVLLNSVYEPVCQGSIPACSNLDLGARRRRALQDAAAVYPSCPEYPVAVNDTGRGIYHLTFTPPFLPQDYIIHGALLGVGAAGWTFRSRLLGAHCYR